MIDTNYGTYRGRCDYCDELTEACDNWDDARDAMKQLGWVNVYDGTYRGYSDICPTCQRGPECEDWLKMALEKEEA